MFKTEQKLLEIINKYKNILFLFVISVLGLVIRLQGIHFISYDMSHFLIPWYNTIAEKGGFHSLKGQVGDYNILYQTFVASITYLHKNCVVLYKLLSIFFDYALAISTGAFCMKLSKKKDFFVFSVAYSIILFLPTVLFDSSYWGQCDSIYTTFVILTLLFMFDERYMLSFIMLGIAFSFNFQTIFIVPFIVCYYICKKQFSILYFFVSVAVFWISGIPAYLNGRSLLTPFKIYSSQTETYQSMSLNIPNFWNLTGGDYKSLHTFAIVLTIALCGIGLYFAMSDKLKLENALSYVSTATWFVWTCLLFLPAMHERYTYLLDILLVVLVFLDNKYLKYAVVSVMLNIMTYCHFLFGTPFTLIQWCSIAYIISWSHFTYTLITTSNNNDLMTSNE